MISATHLIGVAVGDAAGGFPQPTNVAHISNRADFAIAFIFSGILSVLRVGGGELGLSRSRHSGEFLT